MKPASFVDYNLKALQFMGDIVDTFEGGVGKNNEDGQALKTFLEGPRFAALMGNVERGIKGPFYFGDDPSCVDFFLLNQLDWRGNTIFAPLKDRYGVDVMAPYPKTSAVAAKLRDTSAYRNYKGPCPPKYPPIKDEILDACRA